MIKTVFFACDYPHQESIDDQINSWLSENPNIELIYIKFQSNVSAVADSGVSAEYWHTSALIIYKEPEKSRLGIEFGEEDEQTTDSES
ncbi:sporulation protein Cse60 [Bacteroides stercoris]|uniref:sporulation protein Cse60 n=1 Tax=Bacteroides stercoris TaxID=46506 RepID=UPI00125D4EED|nr:sporulation protein Cse60 [Bacteroides stercoris]KAB5323550.1 sporulation protein Cse60 [Bacteroides stercoris]